MEGPEGKTIDTVDKTEKITACDGVGNASETLHVGKEAVSDSIEPSEKDKTTIPIVEAQNSAVESEKPTTVEESTVAEIVPSGQDNSPTVATEIRSNLAEMKTVENVESCEEASSLQDEPDTEMNSVEERGEHLTDSNQIDDNNPSVDAEQIVSSENAGSVAQIIKDEPTDAEMESAEVRPETTELSIRTELQIPRLGLMLVGWGGNNGSTITAALEANKRGLEWRTRTGVQKANWFGSITQASTVLLGTDAKGQDVHIPMNKLVPMVNPDDIVVDGWDISSMNIGEAMIRAGVLEVGLQDQVHKKLSLMKPRPSIYDPDFIAANQADRADNTIPGTRYEQYQQIVKDIREFKRTSGVDKVVVLWTANTERFADVKKGLNTTMTELEKSLKENESEISPSTIFAMAAIAEGCIYINGSPQNTFVPGVVELAEHHGAFIAGDDFKSGQTKLKSVLVDFLVSAGIKPVSIVSYNHLGNNDGKNLSAPQQFRSKEISKSNVVDDMVASNNILYKPDEHPDHCVVIKYVPYVGDSKRAMDEYTSQIMLGGHNTLIIHNTCEDSLLASPLILDLAILGELCSRIQIKKKDESSAQYVPFRSVLSLLSYLCKAPLVPEGTPVVNSLFRQRTAIENILRACVGLPPLSHMSLEHRFNVEVASTEPPMKKGKISNETVTKPVSNGVHTNGTCTNGNEVHDIADY